MPDKAPNPLREEVITKRYLIHSAIWSGVLRPPKFGEGNVRYIRWDINGIPMSAPRQSQIKLDDGGGTHRTRSNRRKRQQQGSSKSRTAQLDTLYVKYSAVCFWCGQHVPRKDASREHLRPVRDFPEMARDINYMRLAHKECNV